MKSSLLLLALLACMPSAEREDAPPPPPNVLFILADDLGWGDLACYGHPLLRTPHLDRLASEGTLFTQFYVDSPVCSPSRAAFLTGRFPAETGIHDGFSTHRNNEASGMPNWLDPELPSVARELRRLGYRTGHFGKWHLGRGEGAPEPTTYGFDVARSTSGNGPGWPESREPEFRAQSTERVVDETLRFIEEDPSRPFYVQCWTLLTHATLAPTAEQMAPFRRFGPEDVPFTGTKEVYYASVAELDRQIGRLLARLDELGIAEETLVIFSSDNGPEDIVIRNASHSGIGSTGPFRGRKRSLYEGGVREPLLVRWPGHVPAGRVDDRSVLAGVDLFPTLCALAGGELPEGAVFDGEDVGDVLRGTARARRAPLFWEWRFEVHGHTSAKSPMLAVRDGDWKLLMNPDRSRIELYELASDPGELDNKASEHAELVEKLATRLLAWQKTLPPGPVDPMAGRNDYAWPRAAK